MNALLQILLIILIILSLPFFAMCWGYYKGVLRIIRRVSPATEEPPVHIKNILEPTITQLIDLGFAIVGYYQIQRVRICDEPLDWGAFLHYNNQVYAAVFIPQIDDNDQPSINVGFTSIFLDRGGLSSTNTKIHQSIKRIIGQLPPEIAYTQDLGNISMSELWQAHQTKLKEFCLTRTSVTVMIEEFIETVEQINEAEIKALVKAKKVVWVEPNKTYRWSLMVIPAMALIYLPKLWLNIITQTDKTKQADTATLELEIEKFQSGTLELEIAQFQAEQEKQSPKISPKLQRGLLIGSLAAFIAIYAARSSWQGMLIFVGVLLLHEGGHVLAMKWFGYRDVTMLFIPFLGALATARKDDASLSEKVWISLAGPLPGLILGIGLAIAFGSLDNGFSWYLSNASWIRTLTFTLIGLNLFNLLPIYPLDGGQVADLLLFSGNPYLGILFKSLGVLLLLLIGLKQPIFLVFALLIALSVPHSFRVAKIQKQLQKNFRSQPPSDRSELIRRIFENLQESPYDKFAFAHKSTIVKSILDIQKEKSARWHTRLGLSSVYVISLIAGAIGGLYAIFPNPQAWAGMGRYLGYIGKDSKVIMQQEWQERIRQANLKIQSNPQDAIAYTDRGRAYFFTKNTSQALADANQAIKLSPKSSEGYFLRSQIRSAAKDTKGAEADLKISNTLNAEQQIRNTSLNLQSNPKDISSYIWRANAFGQLGDSVKALADFNKALELEPKNPEIFIARGQFYLEIKNYKKAIADANQTLNLNPKSAEAYSLRSDIYKQLGDINKAKADAKKADDLYASGENKDEEL
jgi:tetratricopeptide (TPR) repeat protein/Zn-dependent protease